MSRPWDDILSDEDRAVLEQSGYNERGATIYDSRSVGTRPVVVIIDMQRLVVADDVPILEAVKERRIAIGEKAHRAVERMTPFVNLCRDAGMPVAHTRIMPLGYYEGDPLLSIVEPLQPRAGEIIIDKEYPSAFFETSLLNDLREIGADTVILIGNSTSGCIRATAVDARSYGFHVIVPQDYVFDRIEASHKISLLDMWMKYAAVLTDEEIHDYVRKLAQENKRVENEVGKHPICMWCKHLDSSRHYPEYTTCRAFPYGIPQNIWFLKYDHRERYSSYDGGFTFEKADAEWRYDHGMYLSGASNFSDDQVNLILEKTLKLLDQRRQDGLVEPPISSEGAT